ncbi:MAG: hypothetical protein P4M05_15465 [Bradyrhizobium sp.]|nr:hypothetical protein [Bradyrhizobium sp.]
MQAYSVSTVTKIIFVNAVRYGGFVRSETPPEPKGRFAPMHSAIVVINMPEKLETTAHHPKWLAFLKAISLAAEPMAVALGEQTGLLQLAENVWQVNFKENPGAFARLVSCAMRHQLSYGILQLEDAPTWHPASFQPKPHLSRPDPIDASSGSA